MFDIGFWEICIIGIVGLLVIGPDRLPGVARTLGRWVGKAQRMVSSVKSDIHRELEAGELRDLLGEQKKQLQELQGLVDETRQEMETSAHEAAEVIESAKKSWTQEVADSHVANQVANQADEQADKQESSQQTAAENSILPPPDQAQNRNSGKSAAPDADDSGNDESGRKSANRKSA